jgi:hypothetical protein
MQRPVLTRADRTQADPAMGSYPEPASGTRVMPALRRSRSTNLVAQDYTSWTAASCRMRSGPPPRPYTP